MYRCMVIDDEPLALNVLADYIRQTDGLELVDITTSPIKGLQRIQNNEVDLVFLDIQMPELTGIQVMKIIDQRCKVILTTAYPEFALEGYEYNVVDYLLKPVSFERFTKAVQKLPAVVNTGPVKTMPQDYFFVKSEYKLLRIDISQVLYFEALRDYVAIHTADGNKVLTLQSLSSFEKELPAHLFSRIHKSYLISLSKISFIEKNRVVINNRFLPIGETYKTTFLQKINHPEGK
ncbi:MAG TPA: LytTR family DNA-binding domain-containing protein [Ferruginibacter sp.]|nr:DNA-binding response regulator [Chitinophagaceae bacterium]HRI24464.1 LytTR family DNA-binding domain-containing protein [Ferruginibacter sp.]